MILYPISGLYLPTWRPEVSIIVPLYKSYDFVQDQIRHWTSEGISHEIIYVDDLCPQRSKSAVYRTWNSRADKHDFVVKIVLSKENRGFGGACNLGAHHASGKYLVFLNADTTTTPGWLKPLITPLYQSDIGMVGNVQIKDSGEHHGTIDGAGSVWCWEKLCFEHLGRHIQNGKPLIRPYKMLKATSDVLEDGEREMVTGCCFSIRTDLFKELGGFNHNYRRGYWEDSELNMCVRERGLKVHFTSKSIIYHKLSHSQIADHEWQAQNRRYFINKWIESGRLDKLVAQKRPVRPLKISNILIIRDSANGDVLMGSAVAAGLKKKYPGSTIHMMTNCPDIVRNNVFIDEVVDWATHEKNIYHYIVDLNGAYERRPLTNILDAYADEAGVSPEDCELYLHTEPVEVPQQPYVVLHCGATNWVGRHLKPEILSQIASRLLKAGIQVVCVGAGGDQVVEPCNLDLVGQTSINEMAYVIQKAIGFVGIDSMPMHVTQAVNTPGVVFFGSINPKTRLIRSNLVPATVKNLPCLGCHHKKLPPSVVTNVCDTGTLDCESKMTTDDIWNKLLPMIQPYVRS